MISFDEFKKLDLRVGVIKKAEIIEGSDNLLRLEVDLNSSEDGFRQIIAGIAKSYSPQELLEKEVVVVVNLEPKKIRGLESQGMLLAVDLKNKVVILRPEKSVPAGSKVS